jgi:putative transcriptional regulator
MVSLGIVSLSLAVALGTGGLTTDHDLAAPARSGGEPPLVQWRLPGAGPQPATGKLLVARTQMLDPNFAESVVLLIAYDSTGALGLIINRPTEVELREVLPDVERLKERKDLLYMGGPVSPTRMFMLVRSKKAPEMARSVLDDLHVSESPELLERLLKKGSRANLRVFAGYAGWGPGQLDGELERGDWHVMQGTSERVFSERLDGLWRRLLPRNEMEWSRLVPRAH